MGLLPYALHNLLLSKYALLYCEYLFHAVVLSPQLDSHQAQIAWAVGKSPSTQHLNSRWGQHTLCRNAAPNT